MKGAPEDEGWATSICEWHKIALWPSEGTATDRTEDSASLACGQVSLGYRISSPITKGLCGDL
jgi:hypothetical protein